MAEKFPNAFLENSWRGYESANKRDLRIRLVSAGCAGAIAATRWRDNFAHAQSLRSAAGAGRATRTSPGKRRTDEAGLAGYVCRRVQSILEHLAHPQGSGRWREWAAVHRDCAEARLSLCFACSGSLARRR